MVITTTTQKEHQQVRKTGGYFYLDDWSLITGTGKDTLSFLQTQTTNDILSLQPGEGQNSAITDRKAKIIATFSVHRSGEHSVIFLIEAEQKENLCRHLETYLFREDVRLESPDRCLLALQGPRSAIFLKELDKNLSLPEKINDITEGHIQGEPVIIIHKTLTGEEGFVLGFASSFKERMNQILVTAEEKHDLAAVSPETREVLRIEAGLPRFGPDLDGKNILPETGLEHSSVSYNKGCYIGQEVIARIKTYGAPNFALMGLICEKDAFPPCGSDIFLDSKKIGSLRSSTYSYSLEKYIALAYLQRDHRSPDIDLNVIIADKPYQVRACLLPFFQTQSRKDHSKRQLNQALKIYKDEEDLEKPIALLREAIALDPKHADAYEALGVFLSKQNKLDEAISLMKRLVEIDPTEIMAHSNLSVYYMKQGRIEDAEREKGEATALQFEKVVAENMAKKKKEQIEEEARKERENKIEMFKKVLEIDPVDEIANFGLGSIYLDMGRYEDALKPLQIVVDQNKDYSAAYLLLGKTWEKLSKPEEAIEVFRKGIATASRKGDLMPLRDMQNRLNQLLHSEP